MKKIFVIMRKIVSTFLFLAAVLAVSTSCKQTGDEVYVGPVEPGDAYFDGSPIDEGTPLVAPYIDTDKMPYVVGDPTDPAELAALKEQRKKVIEQAVADMVFVDGGTFLMGATAEQGSDAHVYERTVRKVTLSDYYISKFQVTQELYLIVMGGANPGTYTEGGNMRYPIDARFYMEIEEFIARLNQITGLQFTLPTEAQWEFAARGGRKRTGTKYAGSDNIDEVATYWDNSMQQLSDTTRRYPYPVGSKTPNELGLYDMSGNMADVCLDWYAPYDETELIDPKGPASLPEDEAQKRVCRGGGYSTQEKACRVSARSALLLTNRYNYISFRLAHPAQP